MVASILSQVTGQLEKRFLLNAFFPTLLFSIALGLTVAASFGGITGAIEWWNEQDTVVKTVLVVAWVALTFVFANVLANGTLGIVRLFEGYRWPASWFASWGRNHQLNQAAQALARSEDEFQRRFPPFPRELTKDQVAPTKLGNVLLSAERYPRDRYGVDSVRVWPRLFHLVPSEIGESMAAARASMEFLLVVAFLAALYVPLASIALIADAGPLAWFLASLLGGPAVAATAYFAALTPAAVYAQHVRAVFDLHRLELLKSLNVPFPATLEEERRTWDLLTPFLDQGHPHVWRYVVSGK
jgi:hypothetical protein